MPEEKRRRVLEPTERFSEILFGLIMVLTFTGSLSAASSAREEVRTMLVGAIGCNLAWGIVDAIMYVMNSLAERGRNLLSFRALRDASSPEEARRIVAGALPPAVAKVLTDEELDTMRRRVAALPEPPKYAALSRQDLLQAAAVFLLVFLSTFPVVIPFLVMHDAPQALRISNAIALALLFYGGYEYGRYSGFRPWRSAFVMVAIGVGLVALTIVLGG
jgi:VIT1/CCC1 family predicted Fe2+/Mn2+ transporter